MPQYSPDCRTIIHQYLFLTQQPRHTVPPRNTADNSSRLVCGHRVPALLARGWQILRRTLVYASVVTVIGLSGITVVVAQVPGMPTGLSVDIDEDGNNRVALDWTAPTDTVTGYKIEVSTDYDGILTGNQSTSEWGVVESNTGGTTTSYTHGNIGVLPSLQLCYRVSAINANGTGAPSSAVCDTASATQNEPELVAADPITATYPIIVKGDVIEITFDENLNVNVEPAEVQFSVAVHGFRSQPRVETVEIMGAKVILTLDVEDAIRNIDTVTIRYRPPTHRFDGDGNQIVFIPSASNSLQDPSGKLVNLIWGQRARNLTPGPVTVTLALDMNAIDEDGGSTTLRATVWPLPAENFTVTLSTDPASTADILMQELDGQTFDFTIGNDTSSDTHIITASDNTVNAPDQRVEIMGTSETHVTVKPVTLTITDDELGVSFGQDTYSVLEGRAIPIAVHLDQDPQGTVTIPLTTDPPCMPNDDCGYAGVPESITFNSGETVKTFTFTSAVDEDEADKTVTLGFDDTNASWPTDLSVGTPATATVTIRELPEVEVFFDSSYSVLEGRSVELMVRLSEDPLRTVEIPLTATPPCPDEGECDYEVAQSVTFASGETEKTVTFSATADRLVEEDETVTIGFGEPLPDGVRVGSPSIAVVTISDNRLLDPSNVNKELLPRVTQAMIASTLSAISSRIETDGTTPDGAMDLAGSSALGQVLALVPSTAERDSFDLKQALAGKSFVLPLEGTFGGLNNLSFWGRGDYRDMEGGDDRPIEWDGDLSSFHFGADTHLRQDILAGLAVSWSEGDFDYKDRASSEEGRYESEMTSVHPYVSWISSEKDLRTWVTVGYGRGEVDIKDDSGKHSSDTRLKTGAMGVSGHVYSAESLFGYSGTTTLRFKADGHVSQIKADGGDQINPLTSDIQRVQAALEGTHECPLSDGQVLSPTLEIGLRHDSGDGLEGTGVEIGAGARYVDPRRGLTVEGSGRYLVTHSDDYDEWGFQGSVRVDPGSDRRGLALSLMPSWGAYQSEVDQLWSQNTAHALSQGNHEPMKGRLDVAVDYGLPALSGRGLLTPYARLSLGGGVDTYRLGSRLEVGTAFDLSIEGGRLRDAQGEPGHGIQFRVESQF